MIGWRLRDATERDQISRSAARCSRAAPPPTRAGESGARRQRSARRGGGAGRGVGERARGANRAQNGLVRGRRWRAMPRQALAIERMPSLEPGDFSVEPPELFLLSHPILVVRRCAVWPGIRFTGYLVVLQFAAASWPRHTAVAGQSRARLQIVGRWLAGRARRCGLRPIPDGENLLQEIAKLLHL